MEYVRRFQIDMNSHLRSGQRMIWSIVCIIAVCVMLNFHQNIDQLLFMGIMLILVFIIPALVIHINYYWVNRGDVLETSFDRKNIRITHRDKTTIFGLDDISYIEQSISFNKEANRGYVACWDGYSHMVVHLKNGIIITLTSLLMQEFELPVEKEKIKVLRNVYRLAKIR